MGDYAELLKDLRWDCKRRRILDRDKHRCVLCMNKKRLQVHHKRYISGRKPWEYPDNYLITLCRRCHKKTHRKEWTDEDLIAAMNGEGP